MMPSCAALYTHLPLIEEAPNCRLGSDCRKQGTQLCCALFFIIQKAVRSWLTGILSVQPKNTTIVDLSYASK